MARENEHLKSLREWWIRVLQRWWEVLGTFLSLATALGGIIAFAIWARRIESPLPWWNIGFVVGGALLFLIISFLAFHRMRIERDNLKSDKPILFIRSGGWARLANDITANYQRVLLHYEVIITNPSQSVPLGIQRIVLTWGKVDGATRPIAAYTPVVGKIEIKDGEHEPKIKGGGKSAIFFIFSPTKRNQGSWYLLEKYLAIS